MFNQKMTTVAAAATALISSLAFAIATPAFADAQMDATDDVFWTLTLDLNEGQDAAFEELMAEMVTATKMETGAKSYEWFRAGNQVQILERYETNGDAGIHLGNFSTNFAERFTAILKPTALQVYGPAEGGVRDGLSGFGAVFQEQVGGFAR